MGMDEESDLKVETEALMFAAQEHALRTNAVKFNIDKKQRIVSYADFLEKE